MSKIAHVKMFLRCARSRNFDEWNRWRVQHPRIEPDLSDAKLALSASTLDPSIAERIRQEGPTDELIDLVKSSPPRLYAAKANLSKTNLINCFLNGAILDESDLTDAWLSRADLGASLIRDATMVRANLFEANLSGSDLRGSDLSYANLQAAHLNYARIGRTMLKGCNVHTVNAWMLDGEPADQSDLVITWHQDSTVTVDDIRVAQFVHLLLTNSSIRNVIDTIGKKGVLILGRFSSERKAVINGLRNALRVRNFVPFVFDFERPLARDFTETVMTLAGMCLFIIADITEPRSAPLELQSTVPNYMVPFVPIIEEGQRPFAMFHDLQRKYDWVLPELVYDNLPNLIAALDKAIIRPALAKSAELAERKANDADARHIRDYLGPGSG